MNPIINSSGNLPPAVLAGIETLVSGGVAGALGFNVQGAVTAAQNETLNNFCEHNSCGRALAAVGAVVGGAVTAAGSLVDVAAGGLNIAATPAEVAVGSAAGAAVGSAIGALLNSGNSGDSAASDDTSGSSDTTSIDNGTNGKDKPSLLDDKGEQHVLDGDANGGGHRPGTGKPGKSEFPSDWSDEKIKGEISDVATDPNSTRTPGRGGRTIVQGTRDGVDITVVVEPGSKGGRIVTGFPTNVPRNPK